MIITKRYQNVNTRKSETSKQTFTTILYPKIEPDPSDIYTIVYENDRLDSIAFKYYGDVRYWWIIAQANNLGKGSFNVNPETRLRIPQNIDKILEDYSNLNKAR